MLFVKLALVVLLQLASEQCANYAKTAGQRRPNLRFRAGFERVNIFKNYYCRGRSDRKSKKRSTRPQKSCSSPKKNKKKVYTSSDVVFSTENIGETVA